NCYFQQLIQTRSRDDKRPPGMVVGIGRRGRDNAPRRDARPTPPRRRHVTVSTRLINHYPS
ncbi:hypothetical protein J6590_026380, partial [Homalodisca vitripennis]